MEGYISKFKPFPKLNFQLKQKAIIKGPKTNTKAKGFNSDYGTDEVSKPSGTR